VRRCVRRHAATAAAEGPAQRTKLRVQGKTGPQPQLGDLLAGHAQVPLSEEPDRLRSALGSLSALETVRDANGARAALAAFVQLSGDARIDDMRSRLAALEALEARPRTPPARPACLPRARRAGPVSPQTLCEDWGGGCRAPQGPRDERGARGQACDEAGELQALLDRAGAFEGASAVERARRWLAAEAALRSERCLPRVRELLGQCEGLRPTPAVEEARAIVAACAALAETREAGALRAAHAALEAQGVSGSEEMAVAARALQLEAAVPEITEALSLLQAGLRLPVSICKPVTFRVSVCAPRCAASTAPPPSAAPPGRAAALARGARRRWCRSTRGWSARGGCRPRWHGCRRGCSAAARPRRWRGPPTSPPFASSAKSSACRSQTRAPRGATPGPPEPRGRPHARA
jgi:hypothetical protein